MSQISIDTQMFTSLADGFRRESTELTNLINTNQVAWKRMVWQSQARNRRDESFRHLTRMQADLHQSAANMGSSIKNIAELIEAADSRSARYFTEETSSFGSTGTSRAAANVFGSRGFNPAIAINPSAVGYGNAAGAAEPLNSVTTGLGGEVDALIDTGAGMAADYVVDAGLTKLLGPVGGFASEIPIVGDIVKGAKDVLSSTAGGAVKGAVNGLVSGAKTVIKKLWPF